MSRRRKHKRDSRPTHTSVAAATDANVNTGLEQNGASSNGQKSVSAANDRQALLNVGLFPDKLLAAAGDETQGEPLVRLERMMESLRYAEYDINSGIGELVDNAVEAGAHNIWIDYETERKLFGNRTLDVISEVAVVDDGTGMPKEVLRKALVLGETVRAPNATGAKIGRFGVGLTMGGVSLARHVGVYSRASANEPFLYTFLDLDLVVKGEQRRIPEPVPADPPPALAARLEGKPGTIVVLRKCDRLQHSMANEDAGIAAGQQVSGLANFLGRTYRKFIFGGLNMWFAGKKVYLHDPLYVLSPTMFDAKGGPTEPKATLEGTESIELEVPGGEGKKASVTITMSLLPAEWRRYAGSGGHSSAIERRVDENEGVSILRAEREVLYDKVPYIIGARGAARFLEIDRWWGCEISFPPELDSYFHVRYVKRGAEPVPMLRDEIRKKIAPVVKSLRDRIKKEFKKTKEAEEKEKGAFAAAEQTMADAGGTLPKGHKGSDMSPDDFSRKTDEIADDAAAAAPGTQDEKDKTKADVKARVTGAPYTIVPVSYPANFFFETEHMLGRIVVKLNVNHPFYKTVFEPLCGSVESADSEGDDGRQGSASDEQTRIRDGFMLLLLSYAKAESFFEGSDDLLANLRMQWGVTLGAVITRLAQGR